MQQFRRDERRQHRGRHGVEAGFDARRRATYRLALGPFRDLGVTVISLAKRIEEIFVPGRPDPIVLSHDTPALQLVQRARDEAHRFALDFHRNRRDKAMTRSVLDDLPGVGPARKRRLLDHFGTPDRFLQASREELEAVPGLPGKTAREIYEYVNKVRY